MRGSGIRARSFGRCAILTLSLITFGGAAAVGQGVAPAQDPPPAPIHLEAVGAFERPQFMTHARGRESADFLFVVEAEGRTRIIDGATTLPQPFLSIEDIVLDGGEGFLSMAFPPDYPQTGLFYVCFINNQGDIEVDEFAVSPDDPTDADEATRRQVMVIPHPVNPNHNGGQLQFGPDGMLWMSVGDGGGPGDPAENAQNRKVLLGKLLRIDPRLSGGDPYTIPPDNPFIAGPGRDEIWAYGFRNPWRFSFNGDRVAISDVGAASWEEVSYESINSSRRANFGWDNYEGAHLFEGPALTRHELPALEYSSANGSGSCSVIGGYVARDPRLPDLNGRYVYSDFCAGQLRSFVPTLAGAVGDAPLGLPLLDRPSSFGVGPAKQLYVSSIAGAVYRIDPGP